MSRAMTARTWWAPRLGRTGAGAAMQSRPLASAAIRIPERVSERLALVFPAPSPRLYVHEGARQALERKLQAAFTGQVVISITDNRHSIISVSRQGGVVRIRVHHMFLDAPGHIVNALVRYLTTNDREASIKVGLYIEENGGRLHRRRARKMPLAPKGRIHDLYEIFQDLNARYFDGQVNALITWGKRTKEKRVTPRKTIKLGSYSALERLIRLHPVLDRAWVPRYFVAYIVYHEMLHHVMPATRGGGRRNLHPPEFLERERDFRNFDRAIAWEQKHIARLLRTT